MSTPPPIVRRYVAICCGVALVALGVLVVRGWERPGWHELALILELGGLVALARCYPIHLGPRSKLTLDTAPVIAAVVLLPPAWAVSIAAAGMLTGEVATRSRSFQATFNTAAAVIRTIAGVAVYRALVGQGAVEPLAVWQIATVSLAVAVMLAVSAILVETVIGLSARRAAPSQIWLRHRGAIVPEFVLTCAGLCAAALGDIDAALVLLMAPPGVIMYRLIRAGTTIQRRTADAETTLASTRALLERSSTAYRLTVSAGRVDDPPHLTGGASPPAPVVTVPLVPSARR